MGGDTHPRRLNAVPAAVMDAFRRCNGRPMGLTCLKSVVLTGIPETLKLRLQEQIFAIAFQDLKLAFSGPQSTNALDAYYIFSESALKIKLMVLFSCPPQVLCDSITSHADSWCLRYLPTSGFMSTAIAASDKTSGKIFLLFICLSTCSRSCHHVCFSFFAAARSAPRKFELKINHL